MRLTDSLIANERYRGEPFEDEAGRTQWPACVLWDDEVQGLGLRIYPSIRGRPSRKDFIVTWRVGLKSRTMGIGTFGQDCTLRKARRVARQAIDLARRGRDPIEERHHALGIGTAEDLASRFLFEHTSAAKKKAIPGGEAPPPGGQDGESLTEAASIGAAGGAQPGPGGDEVAGSAEAAAGGTSALSEVPARVDAPVAEGQPAAPVPAESLAESAPERAAAAASTAAAGSPERSAARPVPPPATAPTESARREAERPPAARHGPTKVRLLTISDSIYRELQRRAGASGVTMTAYLQTLLERDGAGPAAAPTIAARPPSPAGARADVAGPPGDTEPSITDLFAHVRALQAVEVPDESDDSGEEESGQRER